jgi:hypothetical protein
MTDAGKLVAFLTEPRWLVSSLRAFNVAVVSFRDPPLRVESAQEREGDIVDVILVDPDRSDSRAHLIIEGPRGVGPTENPTLWFVDSAKRVAFDNEVVRYSAKVRPAITIGRVEQP